MIPGFHGFDLIIILVIALLVFGPKKLPEMGAAVGKSIKEFQKGMKELTASKEEKEAEENKREIETLEREIASKKSAMNARETAQPEVDVTKDKK